MIDIPYCKKPCSECPWRKDVRRARFSKARFRELAKCAYDLGHILFACHKTSEDKPVTCAGFLLQQGAHNLTLRLSRQKFEVTDGGFQLFSNYREMAIANGVSAEDRCLRWCRDDGQTGGKR